MITKSELIEYLKHTPENTNYNILYSSLYNGQNKEIVDEFIEVLSRGNLSLAALQPYLAKLYEDDKTISPEPLPPFSSGGGSVPKPLTYDYMPEGYPSKTIGTTTLMEEQEISFTNSDGTYNAIAPVKIDVSEGQTYTVVWDGVEYSCVCHTMGPYKYIGNPEAFGRESTGEPFLYLDSDQPVWASYNTSTSHTIKVTTISTVYQTIDEKYLPESAFTNAEWSKISNKIVDYKQQSLSLSVSGEQINIRAGASYSKNRINDKLKFEDGMVYKINGSITIHSPSTAGGNDHTLSVNGNYTCSMGLVKFGSVYDNYYKQDIELGLYSSSSDDTTNYGYLYVSSALPGEITWTFDINITETGEAKPLPDICIGKNIQRVGDNIIIPSSTAGSTKKFKLTIDDTGTLTASEITA